MKTIVIKSVLAASVLALTALSAASPASARDVDFSLAVSGPNGTIEIGAPGTYGKKGKYGTGYNKGYGYKKGYGHKYGKRGYGYPYGNLAKARAYGYCLYPDQIRQKLRYRGWRGFRVVKVGYENAVVRSYRYGTPYRLRVDRCTGTVVNATPLYRYGY